MSQQQFVHLHLHTEYSISDGLPSVKSLVQKAAEFAMPAVAITDLHNMFGVVRFYKAACAAKVKPIIGSELLIANADAAPYHMVLLCQNESGLRNLTELVSRAYTEGQASGTPLIQRQWLVEQHQGLIALSGGQQGDIGQAILQGQMDLAKQHLTFWQEVFGDRFYLEIQRTGRANEANYLSQVTKLAATQQCPLVATNDVRFLAEDDFQAHEARVCIHQGFALDDPKRPQLYSKQQYFTAAATMQELFSDIPEALENSVEIAKRCNLKLKLGENFLPRFPTPDNLSEPEYLTKLSEAGLQEKLKIIFRDNPEELAAKREIYEQRLAIELDVIIRMGYPGYFLIVADFIKWAKENGVPVGPGRGSGAGSLVAYVLLITDLDPLQYDLLFERFLNPERVSMPDFDIDFCMEGRDRVIEYVAETYGRQSVSQIITFGTMAAKAVVRDVGRVLGHPYGYVDQIAKLIPFEIGMTLDKALAQEDELRERYESEEDLKNLINLAKKLEGKTRNAGKHAGGVVIAPSKLTDFSPLYCEANGDNLITQYDKDDVESAGLVKFDFLGLRTLTIIKWALETINQKRAAAQQELLDINLIPTDDTATFDLLKACNTTAVFQLESRGMKDLVKRLQPDRFEDIVALVALFRPGPLQSGMVDDFIDRKHGRAEVIYAHPDLEPILNTTYGVILYQEQVMEITRVLAGYTLGGADILRRAMGKKKPEEMAKQRSIFTKGAVNRGIAEETATYIFDLMEKFAGYGFNKSHSAAYALVSYQTAYLKAHFPAEFMAAVLSSDLDNTDKVVSFLEDCQHAKIKILAPHVNHSAIKFIATADQEIRFGLGAIKGVGEAALESIITAREQEGEFKTLFALCQRVETRKVNRRVLEALIKAGALDGLGPSRAAMLLSIEAALSCAEQFAKNQQYGQADLFSGSDSAPSVEFAKCPPWNDLQRLQGEKETLGFYLTGHPLETYKKELAQFTKGAIKALRPEGGKIVTVAGLITDVRKIMTKRGRRMAVVVIEDHSSKIEVIVFSKLFDEKKQLLLKDQIIVIAGEVGVDDFSGGLRITADNIFSLEQARIKYGKALQLSMQATTIKTETVQALQKILKDHMPGPMPVKVSYQQQQAGAEIIFGKNWQVRPCNELLEQLESLFGVGMVNYVY